MKDQATVDKAAATRQQTLIANERLLIEQGYERVVSNLLNNHNIILLNSLEDYIGTQTRPTMDFKCSSCGLEWSQRYDHAHYPECRSCHPLSTEKSYKSKQELAVLDFIKDNYSGIVLSGDRRLINPFEVDIVIPDLKIAIEYCGLYWHSENSSGKGYSYHENKMLKLKDKGYRLLTIFSDEWEQHQDLVKKKLLSILGLNVDRIYARKTKVKQIDRKIAAIFINEYHIQGAPIKLPICYGLYEEQELVAVMTFRKGDDNKHQYLLNRFCSSKHIIGGASKLMKAFIKDFNPQSIYSFADLRWSVGDMYFKLGFEHISDVPPMQTYVFKYVSREHKLKMSKYKLDPNTTKTEWEVLQENGYDRIWDCGKMKFSWKIIK